MIMIILVEKLLNPNICGLQHRKYVGLPDKGRGIQAAALLGFASVHFELYQEKDLCTCTT